MGKDQVCKIKIPDKIDEKKIYYQKIAKKMPYNKEYFIELIFKKLKNDKSRKINLKKEEFSEFIGKIIGDN